MSFSEVQICNLALAKFGDLSITALTDATKEARICNVFYPQARDLLLYQHPWNFAMSRADISAEVETAPAFEWDYAYTLPTSPACLRVWELYGSDAQWIVEGGQLLTNLDAEIYIRYIAQVTTTGSFSPAFVNCLSTFLAAYIAPRIAGPDIGRAMRTSLMQELKAVELPEAFRLNAIEGNRPKPKGEQGVDTGNFTWQTEGR